MNLTNNRPLLIAITTALTLIISIFLGILFKDFRATLLGFLLIPGMLVAWRNPRLGLLIMLIYLPFSSTIAFAWAKVFIVKGNLIKYTNAYPLYKIAKDAFYVPALAKILGTTDTLQKLSPKIKPFLIALTILVVSVLITFFFVNLKDPANSSFLRSLIGLKLMLGYIPLVLCGYYLVQEQKDLWIVTRLLIILIVICSSLCLIQYFLLTQGICAKNFTLSEVAPRVELEKFYPSIRDKTTLKAQCFVGGSLLYNPGWGLIRLPGTFSDPWQWGWFLISSSFITYAAVFSDPSRRWRVISWVAIALVVLATLVSGQRIALLAVPVFYLLLFLLTQKYNRWLVIKLIAIGTVSTLVFTQISFIQQKWADLVARWTYSPPTELVREQFQWLIPRYLSPFGQGLGKASGAARRLVSEDDQLRLVEIYSVKLIYEIGWIGFLAFMAVTTILTILTFKACISLKTPSLRHWATCFWVFVLFISFNPYYYPLAVEPVSVYYWLFAGIILKLPAIEAKTLARESHDLLNWERPTLEN